MMELTQFLFADPWINTKKLKSSTTILQQSAFALSSSGRYPRFRALPRTPWPTFHGADTAELTDPWDTVYWEFARSAAAEGRRELEDLGLVQYATMLNGLVSASFSHHNIRRLMLVKMWSHVGGYSRGNAEVQIAEQMEAAQHRLPEDQGTDTHPYAEKLTSEYSQMFKRIHAEGRILSANEWYVVIPSLLTSKSAGGGKVTVKFDIGVVPGLRSEGLEINFTDKRMNFLHGGAAAFMTPDAVAQTYTRATGGIPAKIGKREVTGGKDVRPIYMEKLAKHLAAGTFVLGWADDHERVDGLMMGGANDFTVGKETGNIFIDHFMGMAFSSMRDVLVIARDYKLFDQHQHHDNMRVYALRGMNRAFNELEIGDDPYGPFTSLRWLISTIWGPHIANRGIYEIGATKSFVDWLRSGELDTLIANNLTNRADFNTFRDLASSIPGISIFRVLFQGDDSIAYAAVDSRYNVTSHREFAELGTAVAARNGQELNVMKTLIRLSRNEYLKKDFIFGVMIPLLATQAFASERPVGLSDGVGLIRSYAGRLSTLVARGLSEPMMNRLLFYTWLFTRKVRGTTGEIDEDYFLPVAALWTPGEFKGAGQLPWTMVGASKDAIIALEAVENLQFRKSIEIAAGIMNISVPNFKRALAKLMNDGDPSVTVDGVPDPVAAGREYIRGIMVQERVEASFEAQRRLTSSGARPLGDLAYDRYPRTFVQKAIEGEPRLRQAELVSQFFLARDMLANAVAGKTRELFGPFEWVKAFRFNLDDPLDVGRWGGDGVHPLMFMRDAMSTVVRHYGWTVGRDTFELRPKSLLNELRRDKNFRRDLREEDVFGWIAQPSVLYFPERIRDGLIGMGATPTAAAGVTARLGDSASQWTFAQNVRSLSFRDGFLPLLDMSIENHLRVVEVPDIPDASLVAALREIGFMWSVVNCFRGDKIPRKCYVDVGHKSLHRAYKTLLGRFYDSAAGALIHIYPEKEWEND
jgi:hypothetical protein